MSSCLTPPSFLLLLEILGFEWFDCFYPFIFSVIKYLFSILFWVVIYSENCSKTVSFKVTERKILYRANFSWCLSQTSELENLAVRLVSINSHDKKHFVWFTEVCPTVRMVNAILTSSCLRATDLKIQESKVKEGK